MIALLLTGLVAPVHATDSAAAIDTHLRQARLFAKKKWYDDARAELEAALALPGGSEHYELHRLAHDVAWELLDVPWASEMAEGAARLATDERARQEAQALADSYSSRFGLVTIEGPHQGMSSRLQLELTSVLFDAELKRFVSRMGLAVREKRPLPLTIGLPVGSYLVNGASVQVIGGEETRLSLPMNQLGARGLAALQVTRLEVAGGIATHLGEDTKALLPTSIVHLAVTQPIGPVLTGLFVESGMQPVTSPEGQRHSLGGMYSLGARVGVELSGRAPVSLRPSATLRTGRQPGIPVDCLEVSGALDCTVSSAEADVRVHAPGALWAPGLELSVDYREGGRTTALGTGVKILADQAFGRLPSDLDVSWAHEAPDPPPLTNLERTWTATHLRVLANISFAF